MGVIQRQSIKHALVNLVGLAIGAFSTLLVYPRVLEGYGLFQILLSVGTVGLPVLTLGANTVAVRFFPRFSDRPSGHHGFLSLLLLMCLSGCLLSALAGALAWPWVHHWLSQRSPTLPLYLWAAGPLATLFVTSTVLSIYSSNFKRIVVPSLLLDFSQKLAVPALLIAVWWGWLTLPQAVVGLLVHAALVCVGLAAYLNWLGQWYWRWPDWNFLTPALRREMLQFIGFGALGGFALLLAAKSDLFLVGALRPLGDAGIYAMASFFATAIEIPTKSLYAASASSVARHLADDNRVELAELYRKVSINLLCAGLLLFGCIWVSIDSLYHLMPNSEVVLAGKWVFFFIGLSRLVEMGTGLNNYLIYYSKYYAWSLLSLGLMAVANIVFGYWLIPRLGIEGAALATLLSITAYNLFSLGLVWQKFGLQPFTRQTLVAVGLGGVTLAAVSCLPQWTQWPLFNLLLRSGLYGGILAFLLFWQGVSPDLNAIADRYLGHWLPLRRKR